MWQGLNVTTGPVLYLAAEGRTGLKLRRRAWNIEHNVSNCDAMYYLVEPVQFTNEEDLGLMLSKIAELPQKPVLIVVDTLARCFVGMEENSATDMGRLVGAIDRLRAATGSAVLLIHHSGKPRSGRTRAIERGSSALAGAADTMISLVKEKQGLMLRCEKQKEAEPFDSISFRLKTVTVSDDQSSCVVLAEAIETTATLDNKHERAIEALATFDDASAFSCQWRKETGIAERSFYRIQDDLTEVGAVERNQEGRNVRYTLNLDWLRKREKAERRTAAAAKTLPIH
jgi:hypothetical protein